MLRLHSKRSALLFAAVILLAVGNTAKVQAQTGPLPPGEIVVGSIVRGQSFSFLSPPLQGTSVPSITNGFDADTFLDGFNTPTTRSFPYSTSSSAAVVLTTAPTQYWRFYAPNDPVSPSGQKGSFLVGSNEVRGLTPAQIRDVLALPATPTMQTIVEVPAGTCLLIGTAGPILNAAPPATPTGVWGHGGAVQDYLIGQQRNGAGCSSAAQYPLFIPSGSYIEAQAIGAQALLYRPRAGGGNAGAVAGALDGGPYPALFTPMDRLYNSLDLLNYGNDPTPLRLALVQLDGEVYAGTKTVLLTDSIYVREAVLGRLRQSSFMGSVGPMAALGAGGPTLAYASSESAESASSGSDSALSYADERRSAFPIKAPQAAPPPETVFWAQGIGAWGRFDGDGNAANVSRNLAGGFAGVDRRFGPNWIAGLAAGYTNSFLSIDNPSSSADINTGYLAGYVGASFGPWNLRGAAAGSFSFLDASRSIVFPGFADSAGSQYDATTAQVFGEVGYGIAFGPIATEPFAGLAFVNLHTTSFSETGGTGAAALSGSAGTNDVGYSTLGARAATDWLLASGMVLTPHASAAWQHAFGPITPTAALAFETNGAPFTVSGVPLATDAALVQAGFDLHVNTRITLGLYYFGELAGHLQDNAVQGNLRWRF